MPITHLLENFDVGDSGSESDRDLSEVALEDQKLTAFENGYTAGWEDAVNAQAQDQSKISSELAASLENLSFTYHEALSQLMISVEPVFRSLLTTVLPAVMDRAFGETLCEHISEMTRAEASQPVVIAVPDGASDTVRRIVTTDVSLPVTITDDPELEPGQAAIRIGQNERLIDTAELLSDISEIVDSFFFKVEKEASNG